MKALAADAFVPLSPLPSLLSPTHARAAAGGKGHTVVVTKDGQSFAFGLNTQVRSQPLNAPSGRCAALCCLVESGAAAHYSHCRQLPPAACLPDAASLACMLCIGDCITQANPSHSVLNNAGPAGHRFHPPQQEQPRR